jgi:hypothetical protein
MILPQDAPAALGIVGAEFKTDVDMPVAEQAFPELIGRPMHGN